MIDGVFKPIHFVNGRGAIITVLDQDHLDEISKSDDYRPATADEIAKIGIESSIAPKGNKDAITAPVDEPLYGISIQEGRARRLG